MYEDDYNHRNIGSQAEAQAKHQLEQTQAQSANMVANLVAVQEGKDGKKHWLGMQVSPEMANTLQYLTSVAPTAINDFLRGGVYTHSSELYNKFTKQPNSLAGHKVGLRAAAATSALLIGAQPLIGTIDSVRQRGKDREAIRTALSAIIETDKSVYDNNEVIKTALERTNKIMVAGIKQAAAEMPTVILNSYYAVGSHKELVKKKNLEFDNKHPEISSGGKSVVQAQIEREKAEKAEIEALVKEHGEGERDRIKEIYEQRREDERESRIRAKSSIEEKPETQTQSAVKTASLLGVGALNSLLKQSFAKGDAENDKPCAYQLIMDLQKNIDDGRISQGSNITDQIVEIFQQNEKDRGRSGVGAALMEKLEPLAERIGEVIANRELDPLALVNLVGDGKVVNKRRFIKTEQLEELLDGQRKIFGSHEKTPLDEFLADFQSPKLIMQAIKENLKTLDGKDKAVFASLFSDDVLLSAGIGKKEILPLRTQGHDAMYDFVKSSTVELAQKSPEELKTQGLSEKQIESIMSLNELIVAGNEKEIKSIIGRGDGVVGAVRNARLHEQLAAGDKGDGKKYWTKVIKQKPPAIAVEKPHDASAVERITTDRENNTQLGGVV